MDRKNQAGSRLAGAHSEKAAGRQQRTGESAFLGRDKATGRETLGDDYWERIAEDPASGYKNADEEVDEEQDLDAVRSQPKRRTGKRG
ncbi:hypothetical protein V9K67_17135 [Paraflavisolibacter sp. H34]|uniref:hypothetical protein n=1 Tax=Huijunlia imazamoxiresistens TaxID=3127457 RepID=UPI00301816C0